VDSAHYTDIEVNRLLNFNLKSLSELRVYVLDDITRKIILDHALNCNCDNLILHLDLVVTTGLHPVFDHKLVQRVVDFHIIFGQDE
jgi:hypothetical protein